jgi:hypothetical protein
LCGNKCSDCITVERFQSLLCFLTPCGTYADEAQQFFAHDLCLNSVTFEDFINQGVKIKNRLLAFDILPRKSEEELEVVFERCRQLGYWTKLESSVFRSRATAVSGEQDHEDPKDLPRPELCARPPERPTSGVRLSVRRYKEDERLVNVLTRAMGM